MEDTTKKNEVQQEFIIRVRVTPFFSDPKIVRALLDKIEDRFHTVQYQDGTGKIEVVLVNPN